MSTGNEVPTDTDRVPGPDTGPGPDGIDAVEHARVDDQALAETLESFRAYLWRVAHRELGRDLTAKIGASDIVQDTFVAAQRGAAGFRGQSPAEFRAWLETILRHRLANARRHYLDADKRDVRQEVALGRERPGGDSGVVVEPNARGGFLGTDDTISSPSARAIRGEREHALLAALAGLPEHYRQVVRWHHEERLTFEQIAERLQSTPEAVRKLWGRALLKLRESLGSSHDPR